MSEESLESKTPPRRHWKTIFFFTFAVLFLAVLPTAFVWIVGFNPTMARAYVGSLAYMTPTAKCAVLGCGFGLLCGVARGKLFRMVLGLNMGVGMALLFEILTKAIPLSGPLPQCYFGALALGLIGGLIRYESEEGAQTFLRGSLAGFSAGIVMLILTLGGGYWLAQPIAVLPYWIVEGKLRTVDVYISTIPPSAGGALLVYCLRRTERNIPETYA